MARPSSYDKMSFTELAAVRNQIDRLMLEKQAASRAELREKMEEMAKERGFLLSDVLEKRGGRTGKVAVKYRDPNDPSNTWTGRGRMPRWMVAATRGGKAKKEDFVI